MKKLFAIVLTAFVAFGSWIGGSYAQQKTLGEQLFGS